MKYRLVLLSLGLLVACGGGVSEEPAAEPVSPSYSEIAPVIYMGVGNECMRLGDELDAAVTTQDCPFNECMRLGIVGGPGGRPALAVCGRVSDSGEWVVVDGVLSVENIAGEARVLSIPPDNASALADAPASLEVLAAGHVRLTAKFGDMTGSGVVEIVPLEE